MTSITELRAHISELSFAIDKQKHILIDLEKHKSAAQRDLNAILDPMARLPLEIASDIFMWCLPTTENPRPDPHTVPMVFLSVCQLWNHIALSTPSLWAAIHNDSPRVQSKLDNVFEIWLNRARDLPLSLSLRGPLDKRVQNLMKEHAHRVRKLELYPESGEELQQMTAPFASLEQMVIIGPPDGTDDSFVNAEECIEILRAAPNLVECDLRNLYHAEGIHTYGWNNVNPLAHPCLRHLRLGEPRPDAHYRDVCNSACILQYLTLPALKTLLITDFDISRDDVISFLARSSPPLESLDMDIPIMWSSYMVEKYLRLLPSLTDLVLVFHEAPYVLPFLEALARGFLPNLQNLTIQGYFNDRSKYDNLIGVVTRSRYTELESIRLIFRSSYEEREPSADVAEALAKFAENGGHLQIEQSYV
ncbi:hypothetical protein C8R44DRAFT_698063 [Mycena epipterygia]|nr:hypothetical protein C8R44DRAFT_698063 [Mycena epipterygia]